MSVKQMFTCDICALTTPNRTSKGEPIALGGMTGMIMSKGVLQEISLDFCPKHFRELVEIVIIKQQEHDTEEKN